MRHEMGFDFQNFSPADIQKGIEEFQKDPEVMDIMKLQRPIN
jgi:hypothetical protein